MLAKLKEKPYYLLLLAFSSGILLYLGWQIGGYFLFIGFIPLFEIDAHLKPGKYKRTKFRFFLYLYLALFLWNLLTTWWIYNSTIIGVSFAVTINTLLMTIPFLLFRATKNSLNPAYGYFSFVLYWLSFEYLHFNWEIAWPWLTLGNAFAFLPTWIQWYEITGVLGGSLWILLINIFLYLAIKNPQTIDRRTFSVYSLIVFLVLFIYSHFLYYSYQEKGKEVEIVVIQPNIDPYTEKFVDTKNFIPFTQQVDRFIALSKKKITPQTQLLLFPEAALDDPYEENILQNSPQVYETINKLRTFVKKYPQLSFLTGLTTYHIYPDKESAEKSPTARFREGVGYYDYYNAAIMLDEKQKISFYHKSRLVPGVESIPYPAVFRHLIINMGGTTGGVGKQKEPSVFFDENGIGYAPLICYESVFGDYTGDYIAKKASIICIITNDAWWGNTAGHIHHFHYARLRAIELRRSIARSANTGISGFINQRGDILQKTQYWTPDVLRGKLKANKTLTVYAQYGDYIGRLAWFLAIGLFLTGAVKSKTGSKKEIMKKKANLVKN